MSCSIPECDQPANGGQGLCRRHHHIAAMGNKALGIGGQIMTRTQMTLAALVMLCTAQCASAAEPPSLPVLLSDAQYALNRYQELDNSSFCDTVSQGLRKKCAEAQRAVNVNVENTKVVLLRASRARNPSATDLLDIYDELHEVARQLDTMSYSVDTAPGPVRRDLTEAGIKTSILAENLYGALRPRIEALEQRCAQGSAR